MHDRLPCLATCCGINIGGGGGGGGGGGLGGLNPGKPGLPNNSLNNKIRIINKVLNLKFVKCLIIRGIYNRI